MKRIALCLIILVTSFKSYSQVKSVMLDMKDQITQDSTLAATYAVFGKVSGDSVYTFKKFDWDGILLASGSFKDDSLQVPHGKFTYYSWITPENNTANYGYEINGRERFVAQTGSFLNGLMQGRWITYYAEGFMKQIITYYKGVAHGAFQYYDERGRLKVNGLYLNGQKHGAWMLDGGKQENVYDHDQLISSLRGKKLRDKQAQSKNVN